MKEFFLVVYNFTRGRNDVICPSSNDLWSFFNAKRVIKHGRYRVGNEYSVKHIRHIFNRFERIRWDARWNNVTLIVGRVYGPMNLLFNNRYVHFFFLFLFLRKHLSTRINRISFTILSNRKKVEIHDIYVFGGFFYLAQNNL